MVEQMHWSNAISTRPSLEAAVMEVASQVKQSLGATPDFGVVFISSAYASEYSRLVPLILEQLPLPVLIGCGGAGIVGSNTQGENLEVENQPALSLSVAHLPGVEVEAFHISGEDLPDLDSSPQTWVDLVGIAPDKQPQFILLAEPFSASINDLLAGLDFAYPGSPKVGGLTSSATISNSSGLFYYSQKHPEHLPLYREGTIGVALSGNIILDTIVAQGCRPIGSLYQVTQGQRNILLEVAQANDTTATGEPLAPLIALQNIIQGLSEADRKLAQQALFVGIARDEFKIHLHQGDFLIRNLLGVDPKQGAIAIGDRVRPGQRIQFHLRDAHTSEEDLELLLSQYKKNLPEDSPVIGALMFTCLGRGQGLYGTANFDSQLLGRYLPHVPLVGFFCNGEIGPVGNKTFLHGYTSVFGILRQPQ